MSLVVKLRGWRNYLDASPFSRGGKHGLIVKLAGTNSATARASRAKWAVGSLSGEAPSRDLTQCSSLVCTLQGDMGATGLVGAPGPKGEKGDMVSIGPVWETWASTTHARQQECTEHFMGAGGQATHCPRSGVQAPPHGHGRPARGGPSCHSCPVLHPPRSTPGIWEPRLAAQSLQIGHFSLTTAHAPSSTRKNFAVFPHLIFPSPPLSGWLLSAHIQTELCVVLQMSL